MVQKRIENKIYGDQGFLEYSGYDLSPDSGALVLRRHDGEDETFEGFEFENYDAGGVGPESLQAFVDVCAGHELPRSRAWSCASARAAAPRTRR